MPAGLPWLRFLAYPGATKPAERTSFAQGGLLEGVPGPPSWPDRATASLILRPALASHLELSEATPGTQQYRIVSVVPTKEDSEIFTGLLMAEAA